MPTLERHLHRHEIDTLDQLTKRITRGESLRGWVMHGLDVSGVEGWERVDVTDAVFLGCHWADMAQRHRVEERGAYVFPRLRGIPYDPYRTELYSVQELMEGYDEGGYIGTRDFEIYAHFDRARRQGHGVSIMETLAQRIHDHAIDDALQELLARKSGEGVVGVMGGHGTARDDVSYRKVAHMTWELGRRGYFVASGGGPGIMEAANLGAWLSNWGNPKVVDAAIEMLSASPKFNGGYDEGTDDFIGAVAEYVACAKRVVRRFAEEVSAEDERRFARESEQPGESLAVPTWFYGHEPSNVFGPYIAKYFANSIREDGLLAISLGGVVYAPGSAGTMQEVFMDLAQNHYATFEWRSPMVFLGRERYAGLMELLREFVAARGKEEVYGDLIEVFDDPLDAVGFIEAHPPRRAPLPVPLYDAVGDEDA